MNSFLNHSFRYSEGDFKQRLEERLGRPICLVFTENATAMLSVRKRDDILRIRLHRLFLHADDEVFDEIVSYLQGNRRPMTRFRKFVRDNREQIQTGPPNKVSFKTQGRVHNLRELFNAVNEEYFGGLINAGITWGSRSPHNSVRKRTLGSFSERSNTIRINPVLDKKTVPRYYVAFVVYHEMLHAAVGFAREGNKRSVHSREFRRRERLFKDWERAIAWERGSA
ncbi:MAG TPA: SprT-like domain-containing protein [Nitrospirota bacterium]|nr:SprT-like domain-containing protein [Nitrospirota bacterium]